MRILLCLDTEKEIENFSNVYSHILNLFDADYIFTDIVHVYSKPRVKANLPYAMMEMNRAEMKERTEQLSSWQSKIVKALNKNTNKSVLVNSFLFSGLVVPKLKKHMTNIDYDLIVLLPERKDNLELFLKGRNVNKIIRNSTTPVLVLPKSKDLRFDKTKFVGLLEKPKSQLKQFEKTNILSKISKKNKQYIHVSPKSVKYEGVKTVVSPDALQGIGKFHEKRKVNNIYVIKPRRDKGLMRIFKTSLTEKIVTQNDSTILVI